MVTLNFRQRLQKRLNTALSAYRQASANKIVQRYHPGSQPALPKNDTKRDVSQKSLETSDNSQKRLLPVLETLQSDNSSMQNGQSEKTGEFNAITDVPSQK